MNLLDRLKLLVQSSVNDAIHNTVDGLRGDNRSGSELRRINSARGTDAEKLLKQADQSLRKLGEDLSTNLAREQKAIQELNAARAKAAQSDAEVDDALSRNQNDEAHGKLIQAKHLSAKATAAEQQVQRYETLTVRLKQDIDVLEKYIRQARARLNSTDEHTASVTVGEQTPADMSMQHDEQSNIDQTKQPFKDKDNLADGNMVQDTERMADLIKRLKDKKEQS